MRFKHEILIFFVSSFCVPSLFLISPQWLTLHGVPPCWPILWLLPWSLNKGKLFGLVSGFCLGCLMDGLSAGVPSQIPLLMLLGFWWGQIGTQGQSVQLIFNLALLAHIGSIFYGLSLWAQNLFIHNSLYSSWFHAWSFSTLLFQSILTGLIAPILCSLVLLKTSNQRRHN
tara:strand:+ start:192 stop:704 length:513 start_codon:yes stop_codon:yes gene_type:complete